VDNIEFCRILRKLMVTNDVSAYTISKVAGVSKTTINSWLAGTHSPRVETASIVLGYFGLKFEVVSKQC